MKIVLVLINLFLCTLPVHDISMAVFKIYESGDDMRLAVSLDIDDFSQAVNIDPDNINLEVIEAYLTEHFSMEFDGQIGEFSLKELVTQGDHYKVMAAINMTVKEYKVIDIKNDCLLTIDNQSNIVQVELYESIRDFHMNNKRKTIKIEY